MAAGKLNILILQGSNFFREVTLKNITTGVPLDLTGATVRSQVREKITDVNPIITFAIDIDADPTTGKFVLKLEPSDTTALNFDKAVYDIEVVFADLSVKRVLQGNIILSREVTR